jgi:zinc transporter ZupT
MLVAFWAAHKVPPKVLSLMVAFSAGTMLSAALLDVLPEALENEGVDPHRLFGVLLISLLGFYFLERSALWRHHHAGVLPSDIGAERGLLPASYALMVGDGVHNFEGFQSKMLGERKILKSNTLWEFHGRSNFE